ncbi:hypothetical protein SLAV_02410 [Streptomyces lavendulae subsp. lavendulae]|uniref:Uncharacterized protein n=1 Tax=Streptomyces lavendulae subsp. lavendulae TaxID=58340 RepID=A0A2K8P6R3_STRLA|nr:hypothetical protein [Streptomyces lavendulae]ATZ22406.1 hypothetical protein SLAV_02410 [Streptomyces lavendulae subsp. lavendulae]QUQ52250.1 hypothetical protein SLLC_00440 [Streptomyces lavendulae subsp. lavendulae]
MTGPDALGLDRRLRELEDKEALLVRQRLGVAWTSGGDALGTPGDR